MTLVPVVEEAEDAVPAAARVLRRADAQFEGREVGLLVVVGEGLRVTAEIVSRVVRPPVIGKLVERELIGGGVGQVGRFTAEHRAREHDVGKAEATLYGQRELVPLVVPAVLVETHLCEITDIAARIETVVQVDVAESVQFLLLVDA